MNHQLKTKVFKILEFLPQKYGTNVYHLLQNLSENKNIENKIKSCEDTFSTFQKICNELAIDTFSNTIIEIGSGWIPIMPYFFIYTANVKKVYTYDLNQHYQKNKILQFNSLFEKKYNVNVKVTQSIGLPNQVIYFPKQNVNHHDLPKDVSMVFSRFVLEHVTPKDMMDMHKKFKSTLQKGSYIIHFISPSDHRAYTDSSLSLQDFLKYSQQEWDTIQTRFDYHNRWRLPHYLELFKSLNYSIEYLHFESVKKGSLQEELYKKMTIHEDFKKYTDEELTAGNIIIVLKT